MPERWHESSTLILTEKSQQLLDRLTGNFGRIMLNQADGKTDVILVDKKRTVNLGEAGRKYQWRQRWTAMLS